MGPASVTGLPSLTLYSLGAGKMGRSLFPAGRTGSAEAEAGA